MTAAADGLRLGVLVPCRNEAAVVERKLANLARVRWPENAQHRLLVVDDHSEDATAALAARVCDGFADRLRFAGPRVVAEVVPNAVRPGKSGALRAGLDALGRDVDLVVLTDADVLLAEDALVELARAFAAEPELGMACGAQHFVRALPEDGDPAPGDPAAGRFDRLTARVRAMESGRGRLFSVHGQLLAWRAALDLDPTPGVAADDIDLMLQARRRGARVRLVPGAVFREQKPARDAAGEAQALRRARAYVQVVRHHRRPLRGDPAGELQWLFYRFFPLAAPELLAAAALLAPLAAWLLGGGLAGTVVALAVLAAALSPAGRDLLRLMQVIARARSLERAGTLADRWEMARS